MSWTGARIERLKTLWARGLSASQIANDLGGVTRNGVIGKVHRLGLSGRIKRAPVRHKSSAPKAKPSAPRMLERLSAPVLRGRKLPFIDVALADVDDAPERVDIPVFQPAPPARAGAVKAVMALRVGDCRFPIGDPLAADFQFCCEPAFDGHPYCAAHCRVAFDSVSTARANRTKTSNLQRQLNQGAPR